MPRVPGAARLITFGPNNALYVTAGVHPHGAIFAVSLEPEGVDRFHVPETSAEEWMLQNHLSEHTMAGDSMHKGAAPSVSATTK
jgi:hypothetical protein